MQSVQVTAEGVVGISRAFRSAGARSALVLLYAINDEATLEFMKSFNKHFSLGCNASVAVHRTMRFLRESEYFWCGKALGSVYTYRR